MFFFSHKSNMFANLLDVHAYGFRDLPDGMEWEHRDVVFTEGKYHAAINAFVRQHLSQIETIFAHHKLRFVYVPKLQEQLLRSESLAYYAPWADASSLQCGSSWILRDIHSPSQAESVPPVLLFFCENLGKLNRRLFLRAGYSLTQLLSVDEEQRRLLMFETIASQIARFKLKRHPHLLDEVEQMPQLPPVRHDGRIRYSLMAPEADSEADSLFFDESRQLLQNIQEKIEQLKVREGLSKSALIALLGLDQEDEPLSRLRIDANYHLWLPDYHNMEVQMTPLVKAVYLLFLTHEEGIIFKHLPDYRAELSHIYCDVLGKASLSEKEQESVDKVTNPCLNSINEKCARIREAFVRLFDIHLAEHYIIDGIRGEAKRIALPRDLVIWD